MTINNLTNIDVITLQKAAKKASESSYSPYSKFKVGAAVMMSSRKIYLGCNVENASYDLAICSERTAIVTAIAQEEREILAIAVYTPTAIATPPCGACRQFMREFCKDCDVFSVCDTEHKILTTLSELLPYSFGLEHLIK